MLLLYQYFHSHFLLEPVCTKTTFNSGYLYCSRLMQPELLFARRYVDILPIAVIPGKSLSCWAFLL